MHMFRWVKVGLKFLVNTFGWNIEFSRVYDDDIFLWFVSGTLFAFLNRRDDIHTLDDLAKDDVTPIEPGSNGDSDKELRSIGILSGVSHTQKTGSGVLQLEVLIWKFLAVNGFATSSVSSCKVTTLAHETSDDAVKLGTFVAETLLSGGKSSEVLRGLWDSFPIKSDDNTSNWLAAMFHIKVDLVGD